MSSPRIIAGKARGMRLKSVPGDSTRPITDRVKESLFDILGADIQDCSFLDLFGGTGSVGIEALSRGAAFVCFLENNRSAVTTLKSNLQTTGFTEFAQVIPGDAFSFLQKPPARRFDYIFIAPPQYKGMWLKTLLLLDTKIEWLSVDGWGIVQIDPREYEPVFLQHLQEFDQRKYGSTLLVFYETHRLPENNS